MVANVPAIDRSNWLEFRPETKFAGAGLDEGCLDVESLADEAHGVDAKALELATGRILDGRRRRGDVADLEFLVADDPIHHATRSLGRRLARHQCGGTDGAQAGKTDAAREVHVVRHVSPLLCVLRINHALRKPPSQSSLGRLRAPCDAQPDRRTSMAHERIRRFNTMGRWPNQKIDYDVSLMVRATGRSNLHRRPDRHRPRRQVPRQGRPGRAGRPGDEEPEDPGRGGGRNARACLQGDDVPARPGAPRAGSTTPSPATCAASPRAAPASSSPAWRWRTCSSNSTSTSSFRLRDAGTSVRQAGGPKTDSWGFT